MAHMLPATGQTAFSLPFPSIDVFHSGYHYVSSPTPGGTLGPYWFFGLERMCMVISTGDQRLPGAAGVSPWRGTPTEPILSSGDRAVPDEHKRVREVTIYDANGDALRFIAFIQPNSGVGWNSEVWDIRPASGVYASLVAVPRDTLIYFELRGGPLARYGLAGAGNIGFKCLAQAPVGVALQKGGCWIGETSQQLNHPAAINGVCDSKTRLASLPPMENSLPYVIYRPYGGCAGIAPRALLNILYSVRINL